MPSGEEAVGDRGGNGGVTLETVSLPANPGVGPWTPLVPLIFNPCNLGSKICLSSDSTMSTHSESPENIMNFLSKFQLSNKNN